MKTVSVMFADGRQIVVDLLYPATLSKAREVCERRYRTETIVDVRPHEGALHQARESALAAIREMGL